MRRVAVVLVDRANYARMKPVLQAIHDHPDLDMQVVCAGTMLLERFGYTVRNVEDDGFLVAGRVYLELEGSIPLTMCKSLGIAVGEFASELMRLQPDMMLVIGDRYEALAATIAAAYLNICIAHIQGGEVSGSIDESARHAMTKFAHYHFPATERAAEYIARMGERPETVFMVGCPSGDIAMRLDRTLTSDKLNEHGVGAVLDASQPFLTVLFHPVTTEYGREVEQVRELFEGVASLRMQTLWLWPNIDAGADNVSKYLRAQREKDHHQSDTWLRVVKHFAPADFLRVLANASCLVGNSSSFVRDASFFGTPVVLVGHRQDGRETDKHLVRVPPQRDVVRKAVEDQVRQGRYRPSSLYGEGDTGKRIAAHVATVALYLQKQLAYTSPPPPWERAEVPALTEAR